MEKMINFLFPGDIIEIELDDSDFLKREKIDRIQTFTITNVNFDSIDTVYNIQSYNNNIHSICQYYYFLFKYDKLLDITIASFHIVDYHKNLFVQNLNSFPKIIHRGDLFKNYIKTRYCSVCNLSIKGLCDENDANCEYHEKGCDIFVLGDEVEFRDLRSSKFKRGVVTYISCPIIYGTGNARWYNYSIETINKYEKYLVEYGIDKYEVRLIKREGLIIAPDITCKGCILKDCNNCKFSDMKNKVIFSKL